AALTVKRLVPDAEVVLLEQSPYFVFAPAALQYLFGLIPLDRILRGYGAVEAGGLRLVHTTVTAMERDRRQPLPSDGRPHSGRPPRLRLAPAGHRPASGLRGGPGPRRASRRQPVPLRHGGIAPRAAPPDRCLPRRQRGREHTAEPLQVRPGTLRVRAPVGRAH